MKTFEIAGTLTIPYQDSEKDMRVVAWLDADSEAHVSQSDDPADEILPLDQHLLYLDLPALCDRYKYNDLQTALREAGWTVQ